MRFVIFLLFCVSGLACVPNQNPNLTQEENPQPLVSVQAMGSYTTQSFIVSFFRSSLFDNLLTQRERLFLSVSSLVFAGNIEDRLKQSLNLKYEQVSSYKVKYKVPSPYQSSQNLEVSGLLLAPNSSKPLPLLIYFHPTLLHKKMAPSQIPLSTFSMDPMQDYRLMMIFLALQGYIVLAPDYIGYGASTDQIHPYLYKRSVRQSGAGLLLSAEEALYQIRQPFKKELFIMGYSQGGHGALAFAEFLQHNNRDFRVQAVSAGGGPYDILYTVQEQLKQSFLWKSLTALLLQSYSFIYRWDLDNIVKTPHYADLIFDVHLEEDLLLAVRDLPDKPRSFFHSQFLREIQSDLDDNPYFLFLDENQVYDWRPESPIFLFHLKKDSIVPYGNLERAYRSFRSWDSAPIERKNCSFKKIEDLMDRVKEWSRDRGQSFEIEANHINCDLIFFLETSEYFQEIGMDSRFRGND